MAPNRRRQQREKAERIRRQTEATPNVYASLVHHSWLKRTLQINGDVEGLIEYDASQVIWGRPVATVRVDGVEVASVDRGRYDPDEGIWTSPALGRHQLSFLLPSEAGPVAVRFDVAVTTGDVVGANPASLCLTIGAVRVYVEQRGRTWTRRPPNVPVVAALPAPDAAALPRPALPESELTQQPSSSRSPWWKFWSH